MMSGVDSGSVAAFVMVLPPLYGAVGAWLSHLGPSEGGWDEFFSMWPFASIGAFISVVSFVNLAG